jgi:hypothetical protein
MSVDKITTMLEGILKKSSAVLGKGEAVTKQALVLPWSEQLTWFFTISFMWLLITPTVLSANTNSQNSSPRDSEILLFVTYGDMPYDASVSNYIQQGKEAKDSMVLKRFIELTIKRRRDFPLVINLGDMGRLEDACFPEWRNKFFSRWKNFGKPVIYTPGDNDWTDCSRANQDPLEQLAQIRNTIFGNDGLFYGENGLCKTSIPTLKCEPTPPNTLPELFRWSYQNIAFATVHMVGSRNGWVDHVPELQEEVRHRVKNMQQVLLNLQKSVILEKRAAAVVATQVDPFTNGQCQEDYVELCDSLKQLAQQVRVPVLFVHGDTNAHCLDQPFPTVRNLWRLNAPGDHKVIDADLVYFAPGNSTKPFRVEGLLSGLEPLNQCNYDQTKPDEKIKYNRIGALVRRNSVDCPSNYLISNISSIDKELIGGYISVTQTPNSSHFAVKVNITKGTPNTKYKVYLKCNRHLGTVLTDNDGVGIGIFDFNSSSTEKNFTFDIYLQGSSAGNTYQSEPISFGVKTIIP